MNRIVLLIILNALLGFFLKIFQVVKPIFTLYDQLRFIFVSNHSERSLVNTCTSDYVCNTIDTIGRNFFLVNLTIPLFFFYRFDRRFKECLENLIDNIQKRMKKKMEKTNKN